MKSQRSRYQRPLAAIEIDAAQLHVCVSQIDEPGNWTCQTHNFAWNPTGESVQSDQGKRLLTEALRRIANELKLAGVPTWISLAGQFCVNRIVTGDAERVREELAQLEERSALYLSLGHGPKSLATSLHHVDARRQHALLTVVNEGTLDALIDASAKAGLKVERIESSMVSLCRLVGRIREEHAPPSLILSIDEGVVELVIEHRGLLVLDYRPAGAERPEQIAATLHRHLGRLQRYCRRYLGHAGGQLKDIYLAGPPDKVAEVRTALEQREVVEVHELTDPWAHTPNWQSDGNCPAWEMDGPLGLSMFRDDAMAGAAPNLLERRQAELRDPLSKVLRPLWKPLAASLLAVALGWLAVGYQHERCRSLREEYSAIELELRDARLLQAKVERDRTQLGHYTSIDAALPAVDLAALSTQIAQCLPADTWLNSFSLQTDGRVQLSGGSYSEDGVFEFVRWLGQVPWLANVTIEGTNASRGSGGSGTQFDVQGDIAVRTQKEESNDERS